MKSRPRHIENRVADEINQVLDTYGIPLTRRIPVLGRTGPDLEPIKVFDMAIDVKSRLSVPKSMLAHNRVIKAGPMLGVCICQLPSLFYIERDDVQEMPSYSVVVLRWLEHMNEWVEENMDDGIAALVLHRPGSHVRNATLVIFNNDWSKLYDKYRKYIDDL